MVLVKRGGTVLVAELSEIGCVAPHESPLNNVC